MDKWEQAYTAAQDVITDNLAHVTKTELWLVGGIAINNKKLPDNMSLHGRLTLADGHVEKIGYNIPAEMLAELDTEKAVFGYVVEYVINHFMLPQYFAKFN